MRLGTAPSIDRELPLWPPLLSTRGPGSASSPHAHHAMHVVLATSGQFTVQHGGSPRQPAPGILTGPDALHSIDATGVEVFLVFLDPESAAGAALMPAVPGSGKRGGVRALSEPVRDALLEGASPLAIMTTRFGDEWTARAAALLGAGSTPARRTLHPKVRKALRLLRAQTPGDDASLETLSEAVGLSTGRFMHAFTESIGLPLRPYLQWLKVQRAAAAIADGQPLARAAAAAGFADAAHMSRTIRRMFGVSPSELRGKGPDSRDK